MLTLLYVKQERISESVDVIGTRTNIAIKEHTETLEPITTRNVMKA